MNLSVKTINYTLISIIQIAYDMYSCISIDDIEYRFYISSMHTTIETFNGIR